MGKDKNAETVADTDPPRAEVEQPREPSFRDRISEKLAQLDSEARHVPHNISEMLLHIGELFDERQSVSDRLRPISDRE